MNIQDLLILPVIIPLASAIISIFFWNYVSFQRKLNVLSFVANLFIAVILFINVDKYGIHSVQIGSWTSPFGITFVADMFSAIMVLVSAIIALASSIYAIGTIDKRRESFGFYPLLSVLMMGINGAFLTGDIFNMYVWFEVMLISSFVLLALGGEKEQLEGAVKYVTLNLLSSAIFLAAVGLTYGLTGALNMADIAIKLMVVDNNELNLIISVMFLIAFGIKAAIFPLFFWLPASYHTPPAAISAIFAGLLTKVGVYAIIRVFTLIFNQNISFTHNLILILAGLTMLTGVLGAAAQKEFRRILSFHIVSQIGYMIMGLGLFSINAIAGAVFYIFHHIIVKTNLFFISGVANKIAGSYYLPKLGGMYKLFPFLSILFIIPAMSLAGIPPLSGFWAKFLVIKAGFELESLLIVFTALLVSLLTLFSMTKIWNETFWKDTPAETKIESLSLKTKFLLYTPIIFLAIITLSIGFFAEPFLQIAMKTSAQLLNPSEYIEIVLGKVK